MAIERPVSLERDLLPERIRALREEKGWLQSELAESMDQLGFRWTQAKVTAVETKRRLVSIGEALGLALVFEIPLAQVFASTEPGELSKTAEGRSLFDFYMNEEVTLGDGARLPLKHIVSLLQGASGKDVATRVTAGGPQKSSLDKPLSKLPGAYRSGGKKSSQERPTIYKKSKDAAKKPAKARAGRKGAR